MAKSNTQKENGMWSFTNPFWENVFRWATISALAFGGIGVLSAFISAWVGYEITDATQKDANQRIADAQARGDEARVEAARANERAAAIEAENLKLEAQLAPRRLTNEQQAILATALAALAGKTVRIESYSLDAEAAILGKQIEQAFSSAKVNLSNALMTRASAGSILLGIHVLSRSEETRNLILNALQGVGLNAVDGTNSASNFVVGFGVTMPATPPDAEVFIGVKPLTR
jgi:hypothetical protein